MRNHKNQWPAIRAAERMRKLFPWQVVLSHGSQCVQSTTYATEADALAAVQAASDLDAIIIDPDNAVHEYPQRTQGT